MSSRKFKPGTIGAAIQKLVKRYGGYRMGIYILETALAEAVTGNDDPHTVEIDGKRITQHDHYAAMCAEEEASIERITADIATRKRRNG